MGHREKARGSHRKIISVGTANSNPCVAATSADTNLSKITVPCSGAVLQFYLGGSQPSPLALTHLGVRVGLACFNR